MDKRPPAAPASRPNRLVSWGFGVALASAAGLPGVVAGAAAATLSPQDLQIIGRAVAFMEPPPVGGALAVVYAAGDAASRRDADSIAREIGSGLQVGDLLLPVKVVDTATLAKGGFTVAIAASGANGPSLGAVVRAARILCVTANIAAVQAGFCTLGIATQPHLDIVLNHATAADAGITFLAAFRMMIREM